MQVKWSAVLLFTILYQSHSSTKAETNAENVKYAVMFDAGSSGTRVKVYKYILGRHNPLEASDMVQVDIPPPDKFKPGIDSFVDSIDQLQYYLDDPIAHAKMVVPADQQAETPIMLFATAGMRLLPEDEQNAIMTEIDRLFSDKSFSPFLYTEGNARVIYGAEEAGYGWATVNFLKGTFSLNDSTQTYGVLDLGGASVQNTFRINEKDKIPATLTIELAGKTYPLYAHSHLGYGSDEALDSYIESLIKPEDGSLISLCHNINYKTKVEIENQEYELTGEYNEKGCQNYIKKIFFCHVGKKCPFKNQPALRGRFYGISAFYYNLNGTGVVTSNDKIVSMARIRINARRFCKLTPESLDPEIFDVYNLCFRLNYIYELLKDGYRVKLRTFLFHVAIELEDFDLNWTLGAVLYNSKIL